MTPVLTVAYDANGNTLSDSQGRSFSWDFENRLTQMTVPQTGGGSTVVTFRYDPFGRRIQKSSPSGTTNYLYDGGDIVEEADSAGSAVARYTQGPGVDRPLSEFRSSAASYYDADGLESITSLTTASSTTGASYAYDAFGNLSAASTGSLTNPFRYTGREFDSETGLDFYRARYFDQDVGRFISEDPYAFKEDLNFYRYVRNIPTTLVDPLGLMICTKTPVGLICYDDHKPGTTTLTPGLPGLPPVPPELRPPQPVNICNKGQIALFSMAGPNPYRAGGQGEQEWSDFKDKFIDKCDAAGPNTVPICTQGAGVLGPFAYCSCCQTQPCGKGK